jgi:uncharacterized membrane protein
MLAALWPVLPRMGQAIEGVAPHAPDWALWRDLSVQLQTHIVAALLALAVGLVILFLPKGRGLHKPLGWVWVGAMAVTALSSLFITGLNGDAYSIIHLLTGWTLIALPMGVFAIRNRNVKAHKRSMLGLYLGGLVVAGALTLLPGRFMFQLFFG